MDIILAAVAGFSLVLAAWFYWELRKWANICKHGRIAIAYKRKVQMQAPLTEWYLWTRKLAKGETGRVVYRNGGVTVAIVKPVVPPGPIKSRLSRLQQRHKPKAQAQTKQGTWSIKQDKAEK